MFMVEGSRLTADLLVKPIPSWEVKELPGGFIVDFIGTARQPKRDQGSDYLSSTEQIKYVFH